MLKCIVETQKPGVGVDHFTAPLLELIPPLLRISLGLAEHRRYLGSDATGCCPIRDEGRPPVMCLTDFTLATWYAAPTAKYFDYLKPKCGKLSDDLIVFIAELLPVVAHACQHASS